MDSNILFPVLFAAFILLGGLISFAIREGKKESGDYIETPGGHLISKKYLKNVERLRRKAREEIDREDGMQAHDSKIAPASGIALPGDLTEREAALVQKFVAELRREQGVAATGESEPQQPGSTTRKPSTRRNPRSFQDWQGGASGKVREHRTVQ